MEKIYTIRDLKQQQAHMWDVRHVEEEVRACEQRGIKDCFSRHLTKDREILEAGCGLGAWVIYLTRRGYPVAGIDHDSRVVDRLKQWKPDIPVSHGDIEHLQYDNNSLGAYISLGVVEHFEEGPEGALHEAFRILEPGGKLILTVPYNNIFRKCIAHPLRSVYLLLHTLRGGNIFFAEYRYSEAEVRAMVEKAGFHILETGIDDFIDKSRSLTLWSEFPWLQERGSLYELNTFGKAVALMLNSVSRKVCASGILIVAQKPMHENRNNE